ncbi:MAG: hypothetical protein WBP69_07030, partial [Terriglobales bacterium]
MIQPLRHSRRTTIAIVVLGLTFMAQAQSRNAPAPVATQAADPAATSSQDAQLYLNPTFAFRYNIPYGWV